MSSVESYSSVSESIHNQKTRVLTNQVSFLLILISLTFIIYDFIIGIHDTQVFYGILIIICIGAYSLNRRGYSDLAKHVILISAVVATFLFSLRVTHETFVSLMYFPIIFASFAIFDYKHRRTGFVYLLVCLALYLVDASGKLIPFEPVNLSEQVVHSNRIVNFIISFIASSFIIQFILGVNFFTEKMINQQNEELQKANDQLDQFVYSTSHDLRAPLMSILGLVNIAEKEQDKDMIMQCLKMVEERIMTLDNFITEIIDISRNKKSGVQIEAFNARACIQGILKEFQFMDQFEKINFEIDIEDQLTLYSDQTRFNLIMKNLISNAIKYHNFSKEEPKIKVACEPGDNNIKVQVSDNGYGIPEEHQPKLFDMFFRGTQAGKGTGLGLYIVKETAQKLKGDISLISKVGEGSTFILDIPNSQNGY